MIAVAPPVRFWLTHLHPMTPSEFDSISKLEADLWSAADNLRANSTGIWGMVRHGRAAPIAKHSCFLPAEENEQTRGDDQYRTKQGS